MHGGPHEGGPASYPVGTPESGFTRVSSTMTVPQYPKKLDGITYYIWTDIFFGDMGLGVMNQFVPQLVLGSALDGSSGAPDFKPHWGEHKTWMFGAHYFFEVLNGTDSTKQAQGRAAYGKLYPAKPGEKLFTSFELAPSTVEGAGPVWTLKMGAVDDPQRVSSVVVPAPYMGLGLDWPVPTSSWLERNYTNMCINACWELYGAADRDHLPGSGSQYVITVEQSKHKNKKPFPWVSQWDEDEGAGKSCANSSIIESHNASVQHVTWDISVPPK